VLPQRIFATDPIVLNPQFFPQGHTVQEASALFAKDDNASNLKLFASFSLKNRKMGDE
jgi:hypothetical protein